LPAPRKPTACGLDRGWPDQLVDVDSVQSV